MARTEGDAVAILVIAVVLLFTGGFIGASIEKHVWMERLVDEPKLIEKYKAKTIAERALREHSAE